MDWEGLFQELNVERKKLPFGLSPLPPPTTEDILLAQQDFSDINFEFPDDYVNFCKVIGGGTLGRVRM